MPQIIQHIDAIGRQKQRDVLIVEFSDLGICQFWSAWEGHASRASLIQWLEDRGIPWQPCAGVASEYMLVSYAGQLYIDVPFDQENPDFIQLQAYLENPDGSTRLPGATLMYLPLAQAMENAAHDEPGFWDRWVERF